MSLVRYLQHWVSGTGTPLHVIDFVPKTHPIRQWADIFPWAALVSAIEQSFATRFPKKSPCGRQPIPLRVLFALELLKHELGASDEDICQRLRTDFAVMYACGLREYQIKPSQAHFVLPETLCEFRSRIDEALMEELIAIQVKLLPPWRKAWLAQPTSSSILFRVHKVVNGSPMPRHCITHKKNAHAHRPHRPTRQPPGHSPLPPSPRPHPGDQKGEACLRPQLSRPKSSFREAGATNRTQASRIR